MRLWYDKRRIADKAHAVAVAHWLGSSGIAFDRQDLDRYIVITTLPLARSDPEDSPSV